MATEHEKLTKIEGPRPGFRLYKRMPGWKPDTIKDNGARSILYIEEVVKAVEVDGKLMRTPFQPSLSDEESKNWMLGYPLLDQVKDNDFLDWLQGLSVAARNYNASLYRLRRKHLQKEKNPCQLEALPTDGGIELTIEEAELSFEKAVEALQKLIPEPEKGIVDFVDVNGYIISIRAVREILPKTNETSFKQPGGSESSHWSLSSAFSSSKA